MNVVPKLCLDVPAVVFWCGCAAAIVVLLFMAALCARRTGSELSWRICGASWRRTALWLGEPSERSWTRPGRSRRGDTR